MPDTKLQVKSLIGGRWRLEGILGQGGMSDVYRAVDARRDTGGRITGGGPAEEVVAVKIVRSSDPEMARRLAQEAKALEGFDHPALVRLLDAGVDNGHAYLVMELVDGPTLSARLRQGPLSPHRTAVLGTALSSALSYVHERGVVHRDLKPANVLLGPGQRVRLADFGIAKLLDASSLTVTGSTLGTAAYMAPEQIENHSVGTAADIWSLGMVLLECLTGRRMFEGSPAEVIARRLASPLQLPPQLPTSWRMLLGSMLDADPGRRPTAPEVASLVAAPAFAAPWQPSRDTDDEAKTMAMAIGVPAPKTGPEPTVADRREHTLVAPAWFRPRRIRSSTWRFGVPLAAALVVLAALTGWALSSTGASAHPPTNHRPRVTTTTTLTSGNAAAALVRDVQAGIAANELTSALGGTILSELNKALAASDSGDLNAAGADLGQIDSSIASGATSGDVTPAELSLLTGDVSALASALGTSTTATTTTTSPPSHGHGGGGGGPGQNKDGG